MTDHTGDTVLQDWLVTDYDREIMERELDSFVPAQVFDAHAHLYALDHFHEDADLAFLPDGPATAGMEEYDRGIDEIMRRRPVGGLFFAFPRLPKDFEALNVFVAREVRKRPRSRALMLVGPSHDPELIRESARAGGFVGLKPYYLFSTHTPARETWIEEFLPEQQVRVAHEEGLTIMLHIVRPRALADPANQETIRRYAETYPDMRLILAHAARGFNPHHTIEGIGALAGLANVYFDTSAVADPGANEAIIQTMGHHTLLFGSDYPVTHQRGRPVAAGDDYHWVFPKDLKLEQWGGMARPTMIGIEALRALKVAAMTLKLTDSQIEDIFHNNAVRLLGL